MDIVLHKDEPSAGERDAVDAVLGPPDSGWVGALTTSDRDRRVARGGHAARAQRHLLLPVLHAVQSRSGWISPGALNYICQRLTIPPAEAYGVATFYALFSLEPQPPAVAHVCTDIACMTGGAKRLCADLEARIGPKGGQHGSNGAGPGEDPIWLESPCLGMCEMAPVAMVTMAGEHHAQVRVPQVGQRREVVRRGVFLGDREGVLVGASAGSSTVSPRGSTSAVRAATVAAASGVATGGASGPLASRL